MKFKNLFLPLTLAALLSGPLLRADNISALFTSTSDPSAWTVSVNQSGVDTGNDASRFLTGAEDFQSAVKIVGRADYIASNSTGTTGSYVGDYTQFVFRQTFDLTGYDAATVNLTFQWAADDTGEGFAQRGTWLNRFTLNGGAFLGVDSGGYYNYDPNKIVQLSSGFVAGLNTIDFYVQGNGVTDGFELRVLNAEANATGTTVPDGGATIAMLGCVLLGLIAGRRRLTS
ncbi:MAG: VPDSG-CTERM sorting domain-containing protein [Nibricoccus sp.]